MFDTQTSLGFRIVACAGCGFATCLAGLIASPHLSAQDPFGSDCSWTKISMRWRADSETYATHVSFIVELRLQLV
jgi:hypothetical protein